MIAILAAAAQAHQSANLAGAMHRSFPGQLDLLTFCQSMDPAAAMLILIGGCVYLLFGFYMFKALVMVNAVLIGAAIGAMIGARAGSLPVGAVAGAMVAGAIAWPLLKWAVAVMGGICGAVFGASIWLAAGLEPSFAWTGAATGLVGFGMLSFILFRGSIIMYTSLQGSLMIIVGVLGLMFKYPTIAPRIAQSLTSQPFLLPVAVLVASMAGLIYQSKHTAAAAGEGGEDAKE